MSEAAGRLANPLGPGVPLPGGAGPGTAPIGPSGGLGPGGAGGPPGMGMGAGSALGSSMPPVGAGKGPSPRGLGRMPSSLDEATKALQQQYGQAKATYEQTSKALGQIDHMRKGLERLADKGDVVTQEDIIAEASKLVAHGIDPMALAGVLAEMPQQGGGEALGGWVMGHAIAAAQAEQSVQAAHAAARHQMGVAAVHMLTAHDVGRAIGPPEPQGPMDGGNQLSGTATPGPQAMPDMASGPPAGGGNALMPQRG